MRTRPVVLVLLIAAIGLMVPEDAQALPTCAGRIVTILGTPQADTLVGTPGDDVFWTDDGNDLLFGMDGNDVFCPGTGFDRLVGGLGDDVVDYSSQPGAASPGLAVVMPVGAVVSNSTWPGTEIDQYVSIEGVIGTAGVDLMQGSPLADMLIGLGGNDSINGHGGGDYIDGGDGDDSLAANFSGVQFDATDAESIDPLIDPLIQDWDVVYGGSGNDTMYANLDNMSRNSLYGEGGNDILKAYSGQDTLNGGDGVDLVTYEGTPRDLTISLLTTAAQNTGGEGWDAFIGIEDLVGGSGDDVFTGSAANNDLDGDGGIDFVDGQAGFDDCSAEQTVNCP